MNQKTEKNHGLEDNRENYHSQQEPENNRPFGLVKIIQKFQAGRDRVRIPWFPNIFDVYFYN